MKPKEITKKPKGHCEGDLCGIKNLTGIGEIMNSKEQKRKIEEIIKRAIHTRTKKDKFKIDVIIGGPPCQGFSIAGNIGRKFINDPRLDKIYGDKLPDSIKIFRTVEQYYLSKVEPIIMPPTRGVSFSVRT
jgi:hypothetical protein